MYKRQGQYYVLMRNGFEGFKEIQERTLDVARYLAAELKEMGIFEDVYKRQLLTKLLIS